MLKKEGKLLPCSPTNISYGVRTQTGTCITSFQLNLYDLPPGTIWLDGGGGNGFVARIWPV